MKKRKQAGYRWFDHAVVSAPNKSLRLSWLEDGDLLEELTKPAPLVLSIEDIEVKKASTERLYLKTAIGAVNQLLKKYGQPQLHFRQNLFHLLPDTPETRKMIGNGSHAAADSGRIYMIRPDDPTLGLFIAIHELIHLAAFTTVCIKIPNSSITNWDELRVGIERCGFSFFRNNEMRFIALNEAVTEKLAQEARRSIPNKGPISEIVDIEKMNTEMDAEMECQAITLAICSRLVEDHGVARSVLRIALTEDYLTGTHYFLQLLYKSWPEAAKTLSHLQREPLEIAEAAEQLKFPALADTIRFVHHRQGKKS